MENNNITGKKIKKVLVGFERKEGVFERTDREGNIIRDKKGRAEVGSYDNVTLYLATFNDAYSDEDRGTYFDGFCGTSAKSPMIEAVKLKFDEFESLMGVSFADFAADFRSAYMFHVAQIFYDISDYGDPVPCQIQILDLDISTMFNK